MLVRELLRMQSEVRQVSRDDDLVAYLALLVAVCVCVLAISVWVVVIVQGALFDSRKATNIQLRLRGVTPSALRGAYVREALATQVVAIPLGMALAFAAYRFVTRPWASSRCGSTPSRLPMTAWSPTMQTIESTSPMGGSAMTTVTMSRTGEVHKLMLDALGRDDDDPAEVDLEAPISASTERAGAPCAPDERSSQGAPHVRAGDRMEENRSPARGRRDQPRSNRSRFMTLSHAATKSCTNFCCESSLA
jgi:hypothetical protein